MSYDDDDGLYEMALDNLVQEEHEEEIKKAAIESFAADKLQSYFMQNPKILHCAEMAIDKSRMLQTSGYSEAAFIFAAIAIEVGIKDVVLLPIVYGLVHDEEISGLIVKLVMENKGMDRFKNLLFKILLKYGKVDMTQYQRDGSNVTLWEEITMVQKNRNQLMHNAQLPSDIKIKQASDVAADIVETLIPRIINNLGFHIHSDRSVCNETH